MGFGLPSFTMLRAAGLPTEWVAVFLQKETSTRINDKSVELIGQFHRDDKPFFIYVAHTAPHWPLHALPEDIKKYRGVYDKGWDVLRNNRSPISHPGSKRIR